MPKTKELNKVKKINHTLRNKVVKQYKKGYKDCSDEIKSLSFVKKIKFLFL